MDGQCAAATLGADHNANKDEVRRAFRARAKELHPDSGQNGSESAFIALRQAFEILMATAPEATAPAASSDRTSATSPIRARMFETSFTDRRSKSVDLADVGRRPVRRSPASRPVDEQRNARGAVFANHLAAAMAS